jgi:hypothetical protein
VTELGASTDGRTCYLVTLKVFLPGRDRFGVVEVQGEAPAAAGGAAEILKALTREADHEDAF